MLLASLLHQHGVRHVVVCPGSRNAPLVHELAVHPGIQCHPVTDERSAGFVAIGLSVASLLEPVAVCVTSGSALLNLYPAVAEAYYQQVPLVVVSADRPQAWIDQQDGQTLPQPDALGRFVLKAVNLPEMSAEGDTEQAWHCNRLMNEALLCAYAKMRRGPVHINVPLSRPTYHFHDRQPRTLPRKISYERVLSVSPDDFFSLKAQYQHAQRPMIVCGQLQDEEESLQMQEIVLRRAVCLSDALAIPSWGHYEKALIKVMDDEQYQPDFILYIGGEIVSNRLKQFLRKARTAEQWRVSLDDSLMPDTFMHLTHFIQSLPLAALDALEQVEEEEMVEEDCEYAERWHEWRKKEICYADHYQPVYSSLLAVKTLHEELDVKLLNPRTADETRQDETLQDSLHDSLQDEILPIHRLPPPLVVYANSSAVRLANIYAREWVYCNRGVNGIEGSLSVAAGMALANEKRQVVCVIGDLSFFYDGNALWNGQLRGNLRILLLNNGGGGIFAKFDGLKLSPAREFVMADHHASAEGLCHTHRLGYLKATDEKSLREAVRALLTMPSDRPVVLEVFTSIENDDIAIRGFYN